MRVSLAVILLSLPVSAAAQQRPSIDSVIGQIEKIHTFAETAVRSAIAGNRGSGLPLELRR